MFNFVFERVHFNTVLIIAVCTYRSLLIKIGTATINKFDL
jgi:hypothetical protein